MEGLRREVLGDGHGLRLLLDSMEGQAAQAGPEAAAGGGGAGALSPEMRDLYDDLLEAAGGDVAVATARLRRGGASPDSIEWVYFNPDPSSWGPS